MFTFIKSHIASISASLVDYFVTIIAVQLCGFPVMLAGITGTVSGGIINFQMGRLWVFQKKQSARREQVKRYFVVWFGNLVLNTTGFYVLKTYVVHYIIAKLVISILVAVFYNYPLQKNYVFEIKNG